MKSLWPPQIREAQLVVCAVVIGLLAAVPAVGQPDLEGKARTLESRGHMEMARSLWEQVLAAYPSDPEALAAMARLSQREGHPALAVEYIVRLRSVAPGDPRLAELEKKPVQSDPAPLVAEAEALRRSGQPAEALALYRAAYGGGRLLGAPALAFYETQAATVSERPEAVAALRALADRYPNDQRYRIELGRVLTYDARSRAEGLKILEQYDSVADAQQAVRQALAWESSAQSAAAKTVMGSLRAPKGGFSVSGLSGVSDSSSVSDRSAAAVQARN